MPFFTAKKDDGNKSQDEEKNETVAAEKDAGGFSDVPTTEEIDPVIAKRVRRKLDTHVVPLLGALYLLAFLDRSNIG